MSSADQPLDEQPTRRRPPNSSLGQIHDDVIKCGLDLRDVKRAQEHHTAHFERIEDILAQHTSRFERIEQTQSQHGDRLDTLNQKFDGLDQKVDLVQETLNQKIDQVQDTLGGKIDRVLERLGPGNGGS
ncbi:MAG TPA: hypothetical protein VK611_10885 [Acidimicrobiales bacterium]|nr:hypothetical protein [Acidimicrobiales bacterium]